MQRRMFRPCAGSALLRATVLIVLAALVATVMIAAQRPPRAAAQPAAAEPAADQRISQTCLDDNSTAYRAYLSGNWLDGDSGLGTRGRAIVGGSTIAISSVVNWLANWAIELITDEIKKASRVENAVDSTMYCYPDYNVLIAQPRYLATQNLKGVLLINTVTLSGTTYRVYVFKSGTFHYEGDQGPKNIVYRSDHASVVSSTKTGNWNGRKVSYDVKDITFTAPPAPTLRSGWKPGDDACRIAGKDLPDRKRYLNTFDVDWDGSGPSAAAENSILRLTNDFKRCYPGYNVVVQHAEQPSHWVTSPSSFAYRGTYDLNGDEDPENLAVKDFTAGSKYRGLYNVYVFNSGTFSNDGDGGYGNWRYNGNVTSRTDTDNSKSVTFGRVDTVLDADTSWAKGAVQFNDDTAKYGLDGDVHHEGGAPLLADKDTEWDSSKDYPGCKHDVDFPGSDDDLVKSLVAEYAKCYPNTNVLVTKHLNNLTLQYASGLTHVATVKGMRIFTLDSGVVVNTGSTNWGWSNWGFSAGVEKHKVVVDDGDDEMMAVFKAKDDDGGGSGGDSSLGSIPDYGSNPTTFALNTGSKSVTATQPKDSVATYVFKDGQDPQVTLTSSDGKDLKYAMDTYKVSSTGSPTKTITVNPGTTFQKVDGFGGAMTSSAASLIDGSSKKDEILSKLFTTGQDSAGLSIARSPMGASDLQAEDDNKVYTFEDTKGSFGVTPTSGARRQIEVLKAAKTKAGSDFKLLGTPWTAPAWAKKGGKLTGNECGTDANELDRSKVGDYADYFKRYVDAYDAQGLKPWMVSMQNEPENCKTAMPTTLLNADDEVALSKALKSKLPSDVGVLGWDHNWNDPDYVKTLTSKGKVDAIGYHCYDGTHYQTQTTATKSLVTECSGFTDSNSKVADNLGWEVANLLIGPMRNGSTGSVYWSLAQHADGSPSLSTDEACKTCRGLLTINKDGTYSANQDFYYYGQFGKFVRPGATRVQSNNDGDLSSVAFRDGDTTTVVVLNSGTHADGGKAGSSESDYRGKIVQWDNNGDGQNPSWMVGADGYRRWISDISTYQCLHDDGGIPDAGTQPGGVLDKYINLKDVWAVCGASVMGTNSELEKGTYLKTKNGAKLSLAKDGTLSSTDSSGKKRWSASGKGDRLILQSDGNLVLYQGDSAVWSTKTDGKGGKWLSIRDDGSFIVSTKDDKTIWTSAVDASSYKGSIVQWDGDTASQKTSWQVGYDGQRRVVPNWDTFKCLHDAGEGDSQSVSSDTLDRLKDLNGVQATCGVDRLGEQGELLPGTYLKAGDYKLTLQSNGDMVLWKGSSNAVWSTKTNNGEKHYLELQSDGNLVLYTTDHKAVWSTGTKGKSAGWLVLGDDGSLRLYDGGGKQVWTR